MNESIIIIIIFSINLSILINTSELQKVLSIYTHLYYYDYKFLNLSPNHLNEYHLFSISILIILLLSLTQTAK